jgi:hypothetical protein
MTNLRSLSITAKARGMQSSISRMFKADAKQGDCANSTPHRGWPHLMGCPSGFSPELFGGKRNLPN